MSIESKDIERAIAKVNSNCFRLTNSYGNPGGLLDLSSLDKPVIVIGDLHGSIENLKAILDHNENRKAIKNGSMILVIIGDGMHNDQVGQMMEMESSLAVFEELIKLICSYGNNMIYLRGNHDSFEERLVKSGIKQGLEFKLHLLKHRGEDYVKAAEKFFESLPFFIIGKGYVITHAGPIRNGATRQEIIDIVDNPDYKHQLMWNRLHEFRGNPSLKEYSESDIRKMLERLKLPPDTPFIVGHNPMWQTGNKTGIWRDIIGIKNHIIIYSNIGTRGPYLKINNGTIDECFAILEKQEQHYV